MDTLPKAEHITRQVGKTVAAVICVLMFIVMLYLSVVSFIVTCDMNMNNDTISAFLMIFLPTWPYGQFISS